jgi:hypothetical protein
MATSPNFNWPEPDNTDLVKNGALAIRTAVDAIDTSLVDLKGGTTGQVLSKTSATDMDFTWVAQSSGSSYVAGKNGVINGAFDNWQRGTSATYAGSVSYVADRWFGVSLGSSPTCTMSRQTADTTGLTYGNRFGRNSGQTATGAVFIGYTFESIDAKRFAGQTVTLSFYAKKGADAPASLDSQIRTGTGTDQSSATLFSAGWTGGANNSQTNTITSTMTRYSYTVALGSTVNQIMLTFAYTSTGTAGANEWFQIEGVQLEIASAASAFSRNAPTQALELAACQRYFYRVGGNVTFETFGWGANWSSTENNLLVTFKQTMRVAPTMTNSGTMSNYRIIQSPSVFTPTSITADSNIQTAVIVSFTTGMTQNAIAQLQSNNTLSGTLSFSAEL